MKTCTACNGTGKVWRRARGLGGKFYTKIKCYYCKGKGSIKDG